MKYKMLSAKNLTVEYSGGRRAVDSVSFEIAPGERVALIGANGAGKTSLLLSLVGVVAAKGEVWADDTKLNRQTAPKFRAKVGLVFQDPDDQLFMPNVFEDVAFGPRNMGFDEKKVGELAEDALSRLNIGHLRDRSPLKMSGGEKRLAAIATLLSMNPDYLLFDEPTAFLDPRARRKLREIMNELPQGALIATHDLPFAADACTRVLILKDGKIIRDGGTECLRDDQLLLDAGL